MHKIGFPPGRSRLIPFVAVSLSQRFGFCVATTSQPLRGRFRPFVGSVVAILAMLLLYPFNRTDAQAPPGIGIMYLTNSDAVGDPIHNWLTDPALTNPLVQGIALRTQWGRVEPHEHANANDFYWDFLDQGVALAAAHGKKVSILVTAGVTTPQWVYDAGAPLFMVTEQYGYSSITDGVTTAGSTRVRSAGNTAGWDSSDSIGLQISGGSIPAGATIVAVNSSSNVTISAPATRSATGLAIVTAQISPMPLPWDPVFQAKWGAFIQAFAARYGSAPNLAYVVMGGPGRRAESYFCFTADDMNYFINTLGGLPNWQQGVQWIIDQYGTYFPNTPFILDMASPIPTTDGTASLQAMCDYGVARYPGNHFGVKSDGLLYPSGPPNGSIGATEVSLLCPTSTVGYQFFLPQGEVIDPVTGRLMLDLGLARGINFGAHFIEVYASDCDDPLLASVITSAANVLTTMPPIPSAPSSLAAVATSSSTINLGWVDNASNEIGERIERSVASNGNYALLTNTAPSMTAFTDSNLVDGTQYYYRILSFNIGGSSAFSNEQSAITTLKSPTSLSATAVSSSQINLMWTDNSSSELGYKIEQSPADDLHYAQIATVGPNVTAYSASGLSEGTQYYYRVRAYNAIATSAYCSEKNATTLFNIPITPSGLTITSVTSSKVFLAWTDNSGDEAGFTIQRKKGATGTYAQIGTVGANVTTYTDNDNTLLDGTQYYYQVCAYNPAGNSPFSNEVNGVTLLAAPTSLTATAVSSSQISLTWVDNSLTELGYKIEQSPIDDLHYTEIATVGPNTTSYTASGLSESTKYYYRVRAYNAITLSAYAPEKNATTFSNIPIAPSGLTITSVLSNRVILAWNDNSGNETGFKIQRKQGVTGTYTQIATPGANSTTYTDNDTALLDGTQYYYKVSAYNSAGDSPFSNEVNGVTLLASPTSLTATAVSSSQISLTWVDNSLTELGYKIEQSPIDDLHYTEIATVGPNTTSYTASGLSESTKYYYRVRAYNAITLSAYAPEKNATTFSNIPIAPSGLTITSVLSNRVILAWNDNSGNETGFKIQRKQGVTGTYTQIATPGANSTTYTDNDTALLDGTQYYYKVSAYNSAGDSPFSNEVNGVTLLASPTSLTATAVSSSQISLTWVDNSLTELGYKIEQSPIDDLHYTEIATVGPNTTSYTASGLSESTKYYYRVRAYNAITLSAYAPEKNATTFSNIPIAPSGLTITSVLSNRVILAWNDNSGNETGFKIQRKQGVTGTYTQIATPGANSTTYTDNDTALLDGTQYYYKVSAYNSAGDSPFSNEVNGVTLLASPTSLTATAVSSTRVNLTWVDNSASETGYLIERKETSSGTYGQIGSVNMNVNSYTDTYAFRSRTRYYYRVRATNGTINSGYSNEPFVTPAP